MLILPTRNLRLLHVIEIFDPPVRIVVHIAFWLSSSAYAQYPLNPFPVASPLTEKSLNCYEFVPGSYGKTGTMDFGLYITVKLQITIPNEIG